VQIMRLSLRLLSTQENGVSSTSCTVTTRPGLRFGLGFKMAYSHTAPERKRDREPEPTTPMGEGDSRLSPLRVLPIPTIIATHLATAVAALDPETLAADATGASSWGFGPG
jgi:hypothetical protein